MENPMKVVTWAEAFSVGVDMGRLSPYYAEEGRLNMDMPAVGLTLDATRHVLRQLGLRAPTIAESREFGLPAGVKDARVSGRFVYSDSEFGPDFVSDLGAASTVHRADYAGANGNFEWSTCAVVGVPL